MQSASRRARRTGRWPGICFGALLVLCPPLLPWEPAEHGRAMAGELVPARQHREVAGALARTIDEHYVGPLWFKEELGTRILQRYLELWDPERELLLSADVAEFGHRRGRIGEDLRNGDLDFAFRVYRRVRDRFEERTTYAVRLLDEDLDLGRDQPLVVDRRHGDWATDRTALLARWNQRMTDEAIDLALAGETAAGIREALRSRYIRQRIRFGQLTADDVVDRALTAYVRALDRYGAYLPEESSGHGLLEAPDVLEGIGVRLRRDGQYAAIDRLVPGGPAARSLALAVGDRILAVGQAGEPDLVDVVGWPLTDLVERLRGPPGTTVHLRVLPAAGDTRSRPVVLVRDRIALEDRVARGWIVSLAGPRPPGQRIGVIEVPSFYVGQATRPDDRDAGVSQHVRQIVEQLRADGIDGLILDLRRNRGGSLEQAVRTVGLFIGAGPVAQVRRYAGTMRVRADQDPAVAWEGPLTVLVGARSASAAEIVAAALQDYRRGLVVGERTFGKGSAQNVIPLAPHGAPGAVALTTSRWFRVTGESIDVRGVHPDIDLARAAGPERRGTREQPEPGPGQQPVAPTEWSPGDPTGRVVAWLRERSRARTDHDPAFRALREERVEHDRQRADADKGLLLSERRHARAQRDSRRQQRFRTILTALAGEAPQRTATHNWDELRAALILREAARIAGDLALALAVERH